MCAITKPTKITPVTAMTTFLPTAVLQSATTGLPGNGTARLPAAFGLA